MIIPLYQVDSFTKEKFKGNPAAVCVLKEAIGERLMQDIAAEMNLSETAFVRLDKEICNLRWFTPASEVKLCGHATLAAAHILWSEGYFASDKSIHFNTLSGILKITRLRDIIEMDFPAQEPDEIEVPGHYQDIFQAKITGAARSGKNLLLELEYEDELLTSCPDMSQVKKYSDQGIVITARSRQGKYDFVSRYFAPNVAVDEDPVTGSTHCALVPYWSRKSGKKEFVAYQASKRGGELWLKLEEDRVFIKGNAVTVFKTEIEV